MRLPLHRTAVAAFMVAAFLATPVAADTSVARVTVDVPGTDGHTATSLQALKFTLDAVADFSLVRLAANRTRKAATRIVVVLPASAGDSTFALHGAASHFPSLTIRQADAAGATLRQTVIYNVSVARIERVAAIGGVGRRVTLLADRIHDVRLQPAQ